MSGKRSSKNIGGPNGALWLQLLFWENGQKSPKILSTQKLEQLANRITRIRGKRTSENKQLLYGRLGLEMQFKNRFFKKH